MPSIENISMEHLFRDHIHPGRVTHPTRKSFHEPANKPETVASQKCVTLSKQLYPVIDFRGHGYNGGCNGVLIPGCRKLMDWHAAIQDVLNG